MPKRSQTTLSDMMSSGAVFRELDPKLCLKAIEGYEDEISPAHAAQEAFYRQIACPMCGGDSFSREFLSINGGGRGTTWVQGSSVPRPLMRCADCNTLFNPHSMMIVEQGPQVHIIPDVDDPGLER